MAFFSELGSTLSAKGKDIAKKAKDFADISKLDTQISSEEEMIRKAYEEIGRKYFEQNQSREDDPFHPYFQTIVDSMRKISDFRMEITAIRGVTVCPGCGAEIPASSRFCPACGYKTEETVPPQAPKEGEPGVVHCPSCGALLTQDALFCGSCGHKLVRPEPQGQDAQEPQDADSNQT